MNMGYLWNVSDFWRYHEKKEPKKKGKKGRKL